MTRNQLISKEEIFQTKQLNTERYLRLRGESEVVITCVAKQLPMTRKVAELITHENAKSRVFSDHLATQVLALGVLLPFFLNFE